MHNNLRSVVYACTTRTLYAVLFLLLTCYASSLIIAAAGSGTILDNAAHPAYAIPRSELAESPNAVTAGMVSFTESMHAGAIEVGRTTYSASTQVQRTTIHSAKAIANTGNVAHTRLLDNSKRLATSIRDNGARIIDFHAVLVRKVGRAPMIHNFLTPSKSMAIPVIDSQTSFEMLEQYDQVQKQQLKRLLEQQITANTELGGQLAAGDPNRGGYPTKWDDARQDSMVDDWGMFNRECVSYAAWKVHQTFGNMPYWGGIGNANQWIANAKTAGIPTGSTPKIQSVAISMEGYYGHAMWVDAVDGAMVHVSQYNFDLDGRYSEMWVDGSAFTYIYFDESR